MRITILPAKLQNPHWPNANPISRRQRIKAGELRRVVRADRPKYKAQKEKSKNFISAIEDLL